MVAEHLIFFASLVGVSTAFARLEIEIEGGEGWARSLPTWRFENRWTRVFLGRRPLTGYHVSAHLFVLLLAHSPYALTLARPTIAAELRILSFIIFFWILEDFLWFVINPAYGIRRFRREYVAWHAQSWWWIMPREYWIMTPIAIALYVLSW